MLDSQTLKILQRQMYHFDTLPSTQQYALDSIKNETLHSPFCIHAKEQTQGIGSRGNQWSSIESGLMFSFALELQSLPNDLKLESSSIFFGVIMQQFLRSLGSQVWLKYPNDLYIDEQKIGGILTQKVRDSIVCGIGINLISTKYATLESCISQKIKPEGFLNDFFESFVKFTSWKQIFSIYKLEFHKNNSFFFHFHNQQVCLKDTTLNDDGSLNVNGERIYSLR
ncbi:biotin--[acetyl-CoA-carboxylase] ligase [Helicobacter labetoulli]|uniref:biotin--[acetyl-CoA-carboxylase] ligase n=1 Tax=Helicobacter labetoulli TaxID=2315333 RepID=UPI000EF6F2D9|nr:biotin--[acetyl-CoA-carboxylase] ligase [Helicobacter labetoulli]